MDGPGFYLLSGGAIVEWWFIAAVATIAGAAVIGLTAFGRGSG